MKLTTKILSIILCCILLFGCSDGDQSIDGFKLVYDGSDYHAVVMSQKLWTTQFVWGGSLCLLNL